MNSQLKKLVRKGDIYDIQLAGNIWELKVFAENGGIRLLGSFPSENLSNNDWDFIDKNLKEYNRNPINPSKF